MNRKDIMTTLFFIVLFIIFDNGRRFVENPYLPGASVEFGIIVPIIAGIIIGWRTGAATGFFGVLASWIITQNLEIYTIIPYALAGALAGVLAERIPSPVATIAILAGHFMAIIAYMLGGVITQEVLQGTFWLAVLYETGLGMMLAIMIVSIQGMMKET